VGPDVFVGPASDSPASHIVASVVHTPEEEKQQEHMPAS
jgi:hypothetical protein